MDHSTRTEVGPTSRIITSLAGPGTRGREGGWEGGRVGGREGGREGGRGGGGEERVILLHIPETQL